MAYKQTMRFTPWHPFATTPPVILGSSVGRAAGCRQLQLPQETVVETSGEFREPCPEQIRNGNPERSLLKG